MNTLLAYYLLQKVSAFLVNSGINSFPAEILSANVFIAVKRANVTFSRILQNANYKSDACKNCGYHTFEHLITSTKRFVPAFAFHCIS